MKLPFSRTKWITHIRHAHGEVVQNANPTSRDRFFVSYPARDNDSICQGCGKELPLIWETICAHCGSTFCYNCSIALDGHWFCLKHRSNGPSEELASEIKALQAPVLSAFLKEHR